MQSFIVVGDTQQNYTQTLIAQYSIKPYSILQLDKKIGIADVKSIAKFLSLKPPKHEKKLVVFADQITHEAQSALLKTIEELPSFVFIVIFAKKKENLIPTVVSRCTIIQYGNPQIQYNPEIAQTVENFIYHHSTLHEQLLFSQKIQDLELKNADVFILNMRDVLLKHISNVGETKFLYHLIRDMLTLSPLLNSNNVNARFALENILLNGAARYPD